MSIPPHLSTRTTLFLARLANRVVQSMYQVHLYSSPLNIEQHIGGWADAGDYLKFVQTASYVVDIMGYTLREYPNADVKLYFLYSAYFILASKRICVWN